jgi:hypothetical protein
MQVIDPPVQTCPQLPQFKGSVRVFVHTPEQAVCIDGQLQTPPVHIPPPQ